MSHAEFDYHYDLPEELVARVPAEPRDQARLLIYHSDRDEIKFDRFKNLGAYLPPGALLVFNNTQVVPARVRLTKPNGGRVMVLFLVNEWSGGEEIVGMVDRRVILGETLTLGDNFSFTATGQKEHLFTFRLNFLPSQLLLALDQFGETPLPKYLGRPKLSETKLRSRYQSVWASRPASAAAPTASLHFTPQLLADLSKQGFQKTTITLHVGLGTFAPVTAGNVQTGELHREPFSVPPAAAGAIAQAKSEGRAVVAVGTTVTRALESQTVGSTTLFIRPPFVFRTVDALITNFHLPGSSLLMLVEAFLEHKRAKRSVRDLYQIAISEKFRFFSFGDAMLIT